MAGVVSPRVDVEGATQRVKGERHVDATRLAIVHVASHSRQRHKVVTVIVLASVSTRLPWQNGHAVGLSIASFNRDSDIVDVFILPSSRFSQCSLMHTRANCRGLARLATVIVGSEFASEQPNVTTLLQHQSLSPLRDYWRSQPTVADPRPGNLEHRCAQESAGEPAAYTRARARTETAVRYQLQGLDDRNVHGHRTLTFSARGPFGPWPTVNETD
jgi:hypothetical protein